VREPRIAGYLSLFASAGTLVCCALPALLVVLGLGATVASALSALPWLVVLSRHKDWVFAGSGTLIAANAYYLYRLAPSLQPAHGCPPDQAKACVAASRVSRRLLIASGVIYAAGFSVAYLLGPLLEAFDW